MSSPFSSNLHDDESIPLVIVQGFLGTAGLVYWDHHINKSCNNSLGRRKILLPSLGPVSSLHDRACELFYSLVGGRVDYGAEHSTTHRHSRYGRIYLTGLYPMWCKRRPLHFLGHSVGGPTIIKLQHLLQEGHFGARGHPDMILSVNAVCAPFRGTPLVYTLGESITTPPDVRPFSVGSVIAKFVHIIAYLSPWLPSAFDVHADARSLSYREASLASLGAQLWHGSDWAESQDAAPYDMTSQATEDRENTKLEGRVYPNTFYRSHVARMTRRSSKDPSNYHHRPRRMFSFTHTLLYFWSNSIGSFDYNLLEPPPSVADRRNVGFESSVDELENGKWKTRDFQGEEYWANDGIVPVFSQWHPLPCRSTACEHQKSVELATFEERILKDPKNFNPKPSPGRWSVIMVDDTNHLSLIPVPIRENIYQTVFWTELSHWLNAIETSL